VALKDDEIQRLNTSLQAAQAMFANERDKCSKLKQALDELKHSNQDVTMKLEAQRSANSELKSELEGARTALDDAQAIADQTKYQLSDELSRTKALLAVEKQRAVAATAEATRQVESFKAKCSQQQSGMQE
jgi:septation ring formation regulator EzrA